MGQVATVIGFNPSALKGTKWHEHLLRFVFGGACTVGAGLIATHYGPVIGGLFLAFPAIFPAGASLIEKHEREKKKEIGSDGTRRGRIAAGIDAEGSGFGAIALMAFAAVVWRWLPGSRPSLVIGGATFAWVATAAVLWGLYRVRWMEQLRRSRREGR